MHAKAEPVRLVIWDLDDTFWSGTLTEGGMTYRRDCHDIVLELARRGIVSSICSKNEMARVKEILVREGIWDSFVFASINWDPKGPRLAAMLEAVQLRAPTVLFIDDNAMNRGEAQHYVPGIQVADENAIPTLLNHPLLQGKDDNKLSRLAQYRLLERRQADERAAGGDNTEFLQTSDIRVSIEYDLEPHIDRAIELINRTNQLNFTKTRLPEDLEAARIELRALLSNYSMQAGIIRVRDNYGDYGYCGLYILRSGGAGLRLIHFCFSCRILNMGVESWLYQHLGRPALRVRGEVLSEVIHDHRVIDWITAEMPEAVGIGGNAAQVLDYVYARGGCDLHAVTHYFNTVAREVYREFNVARAGANMRFDHSIFARYALEGLPAEARAAFAELGYRDEDYTSLLSNIPNGERAVWLLSFWADADFALYRHRATGLSVPLSIATVQTNQRDMTAVDLNDLEFAAALPILDQVRRDYEFTGMIAEPAFKDNARLILRHASQDTRIFILMANEQVRNRGGKFVAPPKKRALNTWVRDVAREFSNVSLIDISAFIEGEPEMISNNHFDRMVYFRVFKHIMRTVQEGAAAA